MGGLAKSLSILLDPLQEPGEEVADGDAFLLHGVAVADGDGVFLGVIVVIFSALADGVEVDGDAEGGAHFVLAAVAAADGCGLVVEDVHMGLEEVFHFLGFLDEFGFVFQKGKDGGLDGSHLGIESHDGADVGLAAFFGEVFFVVSLADEGEDGAVTTGGGFDDVGDELFLGLLIEVFEGLAGVFEVFFEVVVGAVGDAFEFLNAEGEFVFDVVSFLRVVGAFAIGDVEDVEVLAWDADFFVEFEARFQPLVGEAKSIFFTTEEFDFHLFEFAGAEGEVTWVDLVAEGFTNLGDTKGQLDAIRVEDVFILNKNGLGSLRAEVCDGVGIIVIGGGSHFRLEHEVEFLGLGKLTGLVFAFGKCLLFLTSRNLDELVCAVAFFTDLAVDHGVGKSADMSGGSEDGLVVEDGSIHA